MSQTSGAVCLGALPWLRHLGPLMSLLKRNTHVHTCIVWSILLPIVNFNITFDPTCFFSLGCIMDRGKRYSVRDILMIYVLLPLFLLARLHSFSYIFKSLVIYIQPIFENESFLRSISSKITLAKEKERKIEKSTRKKGGKEKWLHFKSLCWLLYTGKNTALIWR